MTQYDQINPFAPRAQVDPDDFLMGGGGHTTAKFPEIGTTYTGTVLSKRSVQQRDYDDRSILLTWADGSPRMQVVVDIQCEPTGYTFDEDGQKIPLADDDGIRSLYVKGPLQGAIRDAVRKTGAKTLEIGGRVTVTHSGKGAKVGTKKPPKLFSAVYYPVGQVAADDALMRGAAEEPANPVAS